MRSVSPCPTWINLISFVVAYIDTVEMHFRYMPKGMLAELRQMLGRRVRRVKCVDQHGKPQGWRISVHQPPQAVLRLFESYGGVLCRVDVAFDASAKPGVNAFELNRLIRQQTMLRWRPHGPMLDWGDTSYAVEQRSRDRRSNRDAVIYNDKPSKVTGECDVSHIELRFLNAASVKRQGIVTISDLIELDARALFAKHIKVVAYDSDKARLQFIRKGIAENRRAQRPRSNRSAITQAFIEAHQARLPRQLAQLFDRSQRGRVQMFSQYYPKRVERMKAGDVQSLNIEQRLSWGAMSMIEMTKKLKQRGAC
jgi:hypothetical protein